MPDEVSELSRQDLLRRYGKHPSAATAAAKRRSPFKFLDSYDVNDADIFFGRDAEIEELLRQYHSHGHVLIYGESGSGKSSLVQCGLRSRIPEADALFIPLRVHTTALPAICREIGQHASRLLDQPGVVAPEWGLVETLREVREAVSRPLVLFFDQFEELFIFHEPAVRRRFADDLAAVRQARLNVKIIFGVRQDYLAQLTELEETVEGLFDNRFWLRRMSRENAAGAVVKACETCDVKIDGALAESIIHRLDPGSQGVELPYLQVVMDRLYRQAVDADPAQPVISSEDVEKLGDVGQILGTFLVEEVAKLPSPDTGRQILKAFVTREGTRRTLGREAVAQEAAGFGQTISAADLSAHLNQLASVRILREIAETDSFELRHDTLAATVFGWISEVEKELIEVRDNLVNRFKEYEARGRDSSALLDQGFLDYLLVYRQRLKPLLTDELQRYLETSQRHVEQAARFRRRARRLITSVVGSIIVVCLIVAVWQWTVASQRAIDAEQARAEAVQERDRAQKNFEMARDAVDRYFTRVSENRLLNEPGLQELRNDLLREALDFNQRFVQQHKDDPDLQDELAQAYFNLGRITEDIGAYDQAVEHYLTSRRLLDTLANKNEGDAETLSQLGTTWNAIGRTHFKSGRLDDAITGNESALEVRQKLAERAPENVEFHRVLANSYMNLGLIEQAKGNFSDAAQRMQLGQKVRQQQLESRQQADCAADLRRDFGMGDYNLASVSLDLEDYDETERLLSRATDTFQQLHDDDPSVIEFRLRLAFCYRLRGDVAATADGSLQQYYKARERLESLVRNNPLVGRFRLELAKLYVELGDVEFDERRLDKAAEYYSQAVTGTAELLERHAEVATYRENMAIALKNLAKACAANRNWASAHNAADRSIASWRGLAKQFPDNSYYAQSLSDAEEIQKGIPPEENRPDDGSTDESGMNDKKTRENKVGQHRE